MTICYYTVRDNMLILGERRGLGEVVPGLSLDPRGTERLVKRGWVSPMLVAALPSEMQTEFYAWHDKYEAGVESARIAVEEAAAEMNASDDDESFDLSDFEDDDIDIYSMTVSELDAQFGGIDGYPHGKKKPFKLKFIAEALEMEES